MRKSFQTHQAAAGPCITTPISHQLARKSVRYSPQTPIFLSYGSCLPELEASCWLSVVRKGLYCSSLSLSLSCTVKMPSGSDKTSASTLILFISLSQTCYHFLYFLFFLLLLLGPTAKHFTLELLKMNEQSLRLEICAMQLVSRGKTVTEG